MSYDIEKRLAKPTATIQEQIKMPHSDDQDRFDQEVVASAIRKFRRNIGFILIFLTIVLIVAVVINAIK